MIVFEGIIGAGKSEASKCFFCYKTGIPYDSVFTESDSLVGKWAYFPEPVRSNPYLEDFYKEPGRWALEMQFYLLTSRFKMHEKAIRLEWEQKVTTIFDRSIYGDRAFAYLLWKDGLISERGYDNYEKHFDCMARFLLTPQVVFYLDVSVETALARIAKRGRECEKRIPSDYLSKLDRAYKDLVLPDLEKRGATIHTLNWEHEIDIALLESFLC